MKPEDKVCTLQQAKKLIELGVVFENENYISEDDGELYYYFNDMKNMIPVPDVAELGLILHSHGYVVVYNDRIKYKNNGDEYCWNLCPIYDDSLPPIDYEFYCTNEAQAKAKALIWLIENGHIKAEDIESEQN